MKIHSHTVKLNVMFNNYNLLLLYIKY